MKKRPKHLTTAQRRIRRKRTTLAEEILWNALRKGNSCRDFNRQVPFTVDDSGDEHTFVVDFYSPECKLVVEADGPVHRERQALDKRRTQLLETQHGVKVVRFSNREIVRRIENVIKKIESVCK